MKNREPEIEIYYFRLLSTVRIGQRAIYYTYEHILYTKEMLMMNTNNSDNRAVIYARFSSHNQRDESIDAQERACREYAERKGLQVIEVYADRAKSGTNSERDEFQRMIKDSGENKFRYLIVHKIDRFARNPYDSAIYERKLNINGVTLLSVIENFDDSPESSLVKQVMIDFAGYFSENLAREVNKKQLYSIKHLGGTPQLGFPDRTIRTS